AHTVLASVPAGPWRSTAPCARGGTSPGRPPREYGAPMAELLPAAPRLHPVLAGAVVLVTGAGRGMGAIYARRAVEGGARAVSFWDVDDDAARRVAESLERPGVELDVRRVDLADRDAVRSAAEAVLERFGVVDVLVNRGHRPWGAVLGARSRAGHRDDLARQHPRSHVAHACAAARDDRRPFTPQAHPQRRLGGGHARQPEHERLRGVEVGACRLERLGAPRARACGPPAREGDDV